MCCLSCIGVHWVRVRVRVRAGARARARARLRARLRVRVKVRVRVRARVKAGVRARFRYFCCFPALAYARSLPWLSRAGFARMCALFLVAHADKCAADALPASAVEREVAEQPPEAPSRPRGRWGRLACR